MLIQNTGNIAQTQQPARPASDGAASVVLANASSTASQPVATPELPAVAVKPAAETQPTPAQLQNMVESINKALKQNNKSLEFSVDDSTRRQVVKVVDTETGDIVRQFPSEEMLAVSRAIDQVQSGLLLKREA